MEPRSRQQRWADTRRRLAEDADRVQAWRSSAEMAGRDLLRDGRPVADDC